MAGRPRKPTAVLEASGAFEKDPQRRDARANEPASNGPIGNPPDYFDENHRDVWFELADMAPDGVLAKSDRLHLEVAVRLTVKMRLAPAKMPKWLSYLGKALTTLGMSPLDIDEMKNAFRAALGINGQELALLGATLTRMGMTPADRSRVHGEKPKDNKPDPLAAALEALARGKPQPIQ